MDFQIFHRYNKLVRRGVAKPLTHHCGQEYTIMNGSGEPVLRCWYCNTLTEPGKTLYDGIVAVVKEHSE